MITVYTKENCSQCEQTKRHLDKHGVEYELKDLAVKENLAHVKSLGFRAAPVVVTDEDSWGGYNADKLDNYISNLDNDDDWA